MYFTVDKKPRSIPIEILNMVTEMASGQTDGETIKGIRERLTIIRDAFDYSLKYKDDWDMKTGLLAYKGLCPKFLDKIITPDVLGKNFNAWLYGYAQKPKLNGDGWTYTNAVPGWDFKAIRDYLSEVLG